MAYISDYYRILEVKEGASPAEIKAAYRRKAKLLHPDKNKSPNAHADFVLLTEAYEYLMDNPGAKSADYAYTYTNEAEQNNAQQEASRRRAAYYANMQYRDFVKSDYFSTDDALGTIAGYFYLSTVFVFLLLFDFLLILFAGAGGLMLGGVITYGGLYLAYILAKDNSNLEFSALVKALKIISTSRWLPVVLITIFNLFAILKIGFQTLIPVSLLMQLYLLFVVIPFGLLRGWMPGYRTFRNMFIAFCLSPLMLSLFFTLNFVFSRNPVTETYTYSLDYEQDRHGNTSTTLIQLPRNAYGAYFGVRVFIDHQTLIDSDLITYTFKDGLFGLRVMADYEFVTNEGLLH